MPPALEGRAAELSAADGAIALIQAGASAQPAIWTGLRGMGKTALLRYTTQMAERRGAIVLRAEAGEDLPLAEAFARSLDRAQRELRDLPAKLRSALDTALTALPLPRFEFPNEAGSIALDPPVPKPLGSLVQTLDDLNRAAWQHDRFLTISIDEIQETDKRELRPIISFVHETAGTPTPVLLFGAGLPNAGSHLLAVRTYTERWRKIELQLLSAPETREAIDRPARERGVHIEPAALDALVDATGGYPFFIQEYASAAWLHHTGNSITLEDAHAVIPGVTRTLENGFYEGRFRSLTPRELRYTIAMADLGEGPHTVGEIAQSLGGVSAQFSSIRGQLVHKDVIFSPSPGLVEFRMPLTERFIANHRDALERRANAAFTPGQERPPVSQPQVKRGMRH